MVEVFLVIVGFWGGNVVDDQFMKFLIELIGNRVLKEFKLKYMEDYRDMKICFEEKNRLFKFVFGGVI